MAISYHWRGRRAKIRIHGNQTNNNIAEDKAIFSHQNGVHVEISTVIADKNRHQIIVARLYHPGEIISGFPCSIRYTA